MRNKRLLQFLVVLCALWWALPALAGTVTLTQSHNFQIGITAPTGASAQAVGGNLTAFADGWAEYPYEHPGPIDPFGISGLYVSSAFTSLVSPTPADATLPSGTYMTATQATTTYNGYSTTYDFALSQTQTGSAPGMASGNPGTLYQATANSFEMAFTVDLAGTYTLGVADLYTLLCGLQNNGAGLPYFTGFTGYTDLYVDVWTTSGSYTSDPAYGYASLLQEEQPGDGSSRLADFTSLQSGIDLPQNFSFAVTADALDTINVRVGLDSNYTGSTVPLPPAVWLFGSGLTGLWLMRRRGLRP